MVSNNRIRKKINKIKQNPKNVNFETIKTILESLGYEQSNRGGSHRVFRMDGKNPITIPEKKPVKEIYVKEFIKIVEEELEDEEY